MVALYSIVKMYWPTLFLVDMWPSPAFLLFRLIGLPDFSQLTPRILLCRISGCISQQKALDLRGLPSWIDFLSLKESWCIASRPPIPPASTSLVMLLYAHCYYMSTMMLPSWLGQDVPVAIRDVLLASDVQGYRTLHSLMRCVPEGKGFTRYSSPFTEPRSPNGTLEFR
jgi:hypothetical protein